MVSESNPSLQEEMSKFERELNSIDPIPYHTASSVSTNPLMSSSLAAGSSTMFQPHALMRGPPAPPAPPRFPPGLFPPTSQSASASGIIENFVFEGNGVIESKPTLYQTPKPPSNQTTLPPVPIAPQILHPVKPTLPLALANAVSGNNATPKVLPGSSSAMYELGLNDGGQMPEAKKQKRQQPNKDPFKPKKIIRQVGKDTWEDATLLEWDPNDFRVFAGDLGNEVTDEHLKRAFCQYPSLTKVKVVRDSKTMKSKGYGFLSFSCAEDYIRAMKEMNGKYVGNRPIKLRKSNWKERNMDQVRKKEKMKKKLGLK